MEKKEGTLAFFLLGNLMVNCNTENKGSNSTQKKNSPAVNWKLKTV